MDFLLIQMKKRIFQTYLESVGNSKIIFHIFFQKWISDPDDDKNIRKK